MLSFSIPVLLILCFVVISFVLSKIFFTRHYKLPPGTKGFPVIGNMRDLQQSKTWLNIQLTEWAKQYGDVFIYKVGCIPAVVLSSPMAFYDLVMKRGNIYSSRPKLSNQANLCTRGSKIANMPHADRWRKHRKLCHKILGMQNSKIFKSYQEYESRVLLQNLLDWPETFYDEVMRYSRSVAFSLLSV